VWPEHVASSRHRVYEHRSPFRRWIRFLRATPVVLRPGTRSVFLHVSETATIKSYSCTGPAGAHGRPKQRKAGTPRTFRFRGDESRDSTDPSELNRGSHPRIVHVTVCTASFENNIWACDWISWIKISKSVYYWCLSINRYNHFLMKKRWKTRLTNRTVPENRMKCVLFNSD
jgi:hypothetical protein